MPALASGSVRCRPVTSVGTPIGFTSTFCCCHFCSPFRWIQGETDNLSWVASALRLLHARTLNSFACLGRIGAPSGNCALAVRPCGISFPPAAEGPLCRGPLRLRSEVQPLLQG